jgi:hypothetical protein
MSDDEGKGSGGGYRIELAKSKQAACKGNHFQRSCPLSPLLTLNVQFDMLLVPKVLNHARVCIPSYLTPWFQLKRGVDLPGTKIQKGELRMGVVVEFRGHSSFQWRHWYAIFALCAFHWYFQRVAFADSTSFWRGCVTPAVLSNMKKKHPEVEDLDGFEDLDDGPSFI